MSHSDEINFCHSYHFEFDFQYFYDQGYEKIGSVDWVLFTIDDDDQI